MIVTQRLTKPAPLMSDDTQTREWRGGGFGETPNVICRTFWRGSKININSFGASVGFEWGYFPEQPFPTISPPQTLKLSLYFFLSSIVCLFVCLNGIARGRSPLPGMAPKGRLPSRLNAAPPSNYATGSACPSWTPQKVPDPKIFLSNGTLKVVDTTSSTTT